MEAGVGPSFTGNSVRAFPSKQVGTHIGFQDNEPPRATASIFMYTMYMRQEV